MTTGIMSPSVPGELSAIRVVHWPDVLILVWT
jgi:hypothetical protein